MHNKVFFSSKTQFENLGDGIIGCELLRYAREKAVVIVDNRSSPAWYDGILGVGPKESTRGQASGFKRRIYGNAVRSWFSPGHVYLILKPGHHYGSIKANALFRECVYLMFLASLWLVRVRVVRYGCSLGPFFGLAKSLERIKNKFVYSCTVRENISLDYMHSIGVDSAQYFPDLAFGLDYSKGSEARTYTACVSFRTGTLTGEDKAYTDSIERHLSSSECLRRSKGRLLFLSQVTRDKEYVEVLRDRIGAGDSSYHFSESLESKNEILKLYSQVDFVLSNRLHVLLCAASRGAIPLAMVDRAQHSKITGVLEKVGLGDLIFDIRSNGSLDEFFANVSGNIEAYRSAIEKAFRCQKEIIRSTILE